jgi:hypothetical protein
MGGVNVENGGFGGFVPGVNFRMKNAIVNGKKWTYGDFIGGFVPHNLMCCSHDFSVGERVDWVVKEQPGRVPNKDLICQL